MDIFLQLLINGLVTGSIYALVASGFSLIYSTNKFVHFAHGGVIVLSSYFLYWVSAILGWNFYVASFLTILFATLLGYCLNKVIYQQFRAKKASNSVLLVVSVAILILFQSFALLLLGADVKTITLPLSNQSINIGGVFITPLQIIIILLSLLLFFGLRLLMQRTKMGKAMRAVADNKEVAEIIGISAERIYGTSFAIGSAIAGIAAILVSLEQNITPLMGTSLIIKGFTGSVIGGIGSVPGAIVGSLFLGLAENFGTWFVSAGFKDAIAFILLFLFLLIKPQGLFGNKNNQK